MTYAILFNPGHNRVYFESSIILSVSEFRIVTKSFNSIIDNVEYASIEGIKYLVFDTRRLLNSSEIKAISNLSFMYAFFKVESINDCTYLSPIELQRVEYIDEGISSILKYSGKTNEIFTRMMINIASSFHTDVKNIKLLDPVSGKGTTLYEGLVKGFDVYGIEIGDKVVGEAVLFMKRFLENARYKFEYTSIKISGPNKSYTALKHTFTVAKTKEEQKNRNTKIIEFISGNSVYANKYYKKEYFDIIVGDLPYGIQHGNVTKEKQSSITRNPSELLKLCLPAWVDVLKHKGTIVISWNKNVLSRKDIEQIFQENNLLIEKEEVYMSFVHRVDQSITRDILVATKV